MQTHDTNSEYLSLAQIAIKAMDIYKLPGAFWIEYFPWLKFLPSWAPGASAQRFAERYAPAIYALRDKAFDEVLRNMVGDASMT